MKLARNEPDDAEYRAVRMKPLGSLSPGMRKFGDDARR